MDTEEERYFEEVGRQELEQAMNSIEYQHFEMMFNQIFGEQSERETKPV